MLNIKHMLYDEVVNNSSKRLFELIVTRFDPGDIEVIRSALIFAAKAHSKQKRTSGEPYITHPIAVAQIIAEMGLDKESIVAALLHDVVEDTNHSIEEIEEYFGSTVAELVAGLTKLNQIESKSGKVKQSENLRKLLIAVSKDIRVLLVKFADRLHNMRTLDSFKSKKKRLRIAKDTIEIYAPLAERMGVHFFKNELYDLSFNEINPEIRSAIAKKIKKIKEYELTQISNIARDIVALLESHNVPAEVQGREKTPFSIWKKTESKKISFEQLFDIFALRIITDTIDQCYIILGLLHTKYHSVPSHFCDYISNPKLNGYRSIHTVIFAGNNECIEVQVRTKEMHKMAEFGIAAHWAYKQQHKINEKSEVKYQYKWLSKIREILDRTKNFNDIVQNTKLEMYYDQIFCFTPKGDVISLPRNATILDMAFELDVKVALHYGGAFINGERADMKTMIKNGDHVEILVSDNITLCKSWYYIVTTAKAKLEIKIYLEEFANQKFMEFGRSFLEKEAAYHNIKVNETILLNAVKKFGFHSIEDLLSQVGKKIIAPHMILELVKPRGMFVALKKCLHMIFKVGIKTPDAHGEEYNLDELFFVKYPFCCDVKERNVRAIHDNPINRTIVLHSLSCPKAEALGEKSFILEQEIIDNFNDEKNFTLEILLAPDVHSISNIFDLILERSISSYNVITNITQDKTLVLIIQLFHIREVVLHKVIQSIKNTEEVIEVTII